MEAKVFSEQKPGKPTYAEILSRTSGTNKTSSGKAGELKQDCLITISQSEFHQTLENKDKEISDLHQQNTTLLSEIQNLKNLIHKKDEDASLKVHQLEEEITREKTEKEKIDSSLQLKDELEQLKQTLVSQKSQAEKETSLLYTELSKKNKLYLNARDKTIELEAAISAEKTRTKEVEASLAQKMEEIGKVKVSFTKMEEDMRAQRLQWEQEKSRLLTEQYQTIYNMRSALTETQKVLEDQTQLWQREKSGLLEIISTLKGDLEQKEEERKTTEEVLMEKLNNMEEQIENIKKKTKKKSLFRRFLGIFKRRDRTPPP